MNLDQKLESIARRAVTLGIPSLLVGTKHDKDKVTIRFQDINMSDALTILLTGIHQAVDIEMKNHPEYSTEYVNFFLEMVRDIDASVRNANEKVKNFKARK